MSAPHEDGVALVSRASANDSSSKHEGSDSEPPKGAAAAGEAFQQHDIRSANDRAPAPSAHSGEDAASDDDEEDGTPCAGSSGGGGTGPLTPEAADAVLKQIEFYFSDASLPSDKKLLKQIRKDPEGYVPIKMFANFRKVRALTRDVEAIASALKPSGILELSADNKQVKRLVPVPEYDIEEIQKRTVVVENLPVGSTIESVTKMMRMYGTVKLVRICSKDTKGKLPTWLTTSLGAQGLHSVGSGALSTRPSAGGPSTPSGAPDKPPHAYVEFADEEEAVMAVAALHDTEGWRPLGVQVHHLIFPSSSTPQTAAARVGPFHNPPGSAIATPRAAGTPSKGALQRRNSREPFAAASPSHAARSLTIEPRGASFVGGAGALASWRTPSATAGANSITPTAVAALSPFHPLGKRSSTCYSSANSPTAAAHSDGSASLQQAPTPATPSRLVASSAQHAGASQGGAAEGKRYLPPGRRTSATPGALATLAEPSNTSPTRDAAPLADAAAAPWLGASDGPAQRTVSHSVLLDLVQPAQLALRPIRTSRANTATAVHLDAMPGSAPAAAAAAALLLQAADQSASGGSKPPSPLVDVAQLLTPSKSSAPQPLQQAGEAPEADAMVVVAAAAASAAAAAATASLATRTSQTTEQLSSSATAGGKRTPGGAAAAAAAGAPKFALDLPPPTHAPKTLVTRPSASSTPPPAREPAAATAAAAASAAAAAVAAAAAAHAATFPPMSPNGRAAPQQQQAPAASGGSTLRHLATPFHPSGQYVTEVEDFINSIIPASPTPPAAGAPSGGGGVAVDEEVARFRAALEEARGVNPASAQAQAHASRALAAAAAGGAAASPRPVDVPPARPKPGADEQQPAGAAAAAVVAAALAPAHSPAAAAAATMPTRPARAVAAAAPVAVAAAAECTSSTSQELSPHSSSSSGALLAPSSSASAAGPLSPTPPHHDQGAAGAGAIVIAHTDPGSGLGPGQQQHQHLKPVHLSAAGETTTTLAPHPPVTRAPVTLGHSASGGVLKVGGGGSGALRADAKALPPKPQGASAAAVAAAAAAAAATTAGGAGPASGGASAAHHSVTFAPGCDLDREGVEEDEEDVDDDEVGDEEGGEEGLGSLGGGAPGGDAAKRRRRRRGSRAGSRSRRASGSAGGAVAAAAAAALAALSHPSGNSSTAGAEHEGGAAGGEVPARRPVFLQHRYSDHHGSNTSSVAGAAPSPPMRQGVAGGPRSTGGGGAASGHPVGGGRASAAGAVGRHTAHHPGGMWTHNGPSSAGGALAGGAGGAPHHAGVLRRQSKGELMGPGTGRGAPPSEYRAGAEPMPVGKFVASAGGAFGEGMAVPVSSGGGGGHTGAVGVVVAAGPDGTRGFRMPRSRGGAPPPQQAALPAV